jgi:predicted nucleic acid-binding protein
VDRVFLDANVLFSAAYRTASGLVRLWQLADVELITSAFAVSEAARNLSLDAQRLRLVDLLGKVVIVPAGPMRDLPSGVALPEKDAPILFASINSQATHLLTGDKRHFGPLFGQTVSGVLVQLPADYLSAYHGGC